MKAKSLDKIRGLSKDFILNIIASFISVGIMQLMVYPQFAILLSANDYGTMLTMMGFVSVITLALGNNLCYVRLLENKNYEKENLSGDFQIIVLICAIIAFVASAICAFFLSLSVSVVIAVAISTAVTVYKSYYLVIYRVKIDYKRNLIANIFMGAAYAFAAFTIAHFMDWPWVFTFSAVVGLVYIWLTSDIMREPYKITPKFKSTSKKTATIIASGFIGNLNTYLDRFMLYPLLGGTSVSIYATAAFFSKSLNLVLSPITSVVLSYITGGKIAINKKKYWLINLLFVGCGFFFVLISINIGKFITGFLYPTLIEDASPYLFIASTAIIIGIMSSFTGIVVLAYAPVYWQVVNPFIKFTLYFISGYFLIKNMGILGLCISNIITNTICYILFFIVGLIYVEK